MLKAIIQTLVIAIVIVAVATVIKSFTAQSPEELAQTVMDSDAKCKQGDKDACENENEAKAKAKELTPEEYIIYMTKLGLALEAE